MDLLLVRDDDIPGLIAEGVCDMGIVGRNLLEELEAEREAAGAAPAVGTLRTLGFGRCRLSIAVPNDWDWAGPQRLAGTRIATSYPHLLARWLPDAALRQQVLVDNPLALYDLVPAVPQDLAPTTAA